MLLLFQAGSASLKDVAETGIFDTLAVKQNAIKMACNAAVTILRVDQVGCYIPDYHKAISVLGLRISYIV